MKTALTLCSLAVFILLSACANRPAVYRPSSFEAAIPRSILVLPVINNTVDVDAPLFALSSLSMPLGQKGYYVFPVHTVKSVLEQEGLYEGETIRQLGSPLLANLFGADSVMYVEIDKWDAQYMLLTTTVTVSLTYTLEDSTGAQLWRETVATQYAPTNNSSGNPMADLVAAAITAGLARAAPSYMPLMHRANNIAFISGPTAIPDGPYATKQGGAQ